MKNFAFTIIALLTFISTQAQDIQDGYYRVWNFATERFVYIVDNKGSVNLSTTDADLNSIELWKYLDKAVSRPCTVMYFKHIDGRQYDIMSQGTGISKILDNMYVSIRKVSDASAPNTYLAYGTQSGATKYLADGGLKTKYEDGVMSTNVTKEEYKHFRYWYITPIKDDTDHYFGILPTIQNGGKHYHAFYAEFPFKPKSTGIKLYYITLVDKGMAVKTEIPAGATVPGYSPILVECSSANTSDNRLTLGGTPSFTITGNMLRGVMFNNPAKDKHNNQTRYDAQTMRVLGTMQDGSLGFIKSTAEFLPANSSYLLLPQDGQQYPDEIKIVTQEEYDKASSGIDEITADENVNMPDVYNCQGILLKQNACQDYINNLKSGLYIIGGKKIFIK